MKKLNARDQKKLKLKVENTIIISVYNTVQ